MFVRYGMTDISEAVGSGFDFLTVVMNAHRAFLERFELFVELNCSIVEGIGFVEKKMGKREAANRNSEEMTPHMIIWFLNVSGD